MLKIFLKKFSFLKLQKQAQKSRGWKTKTLLFLIPENIGDRVLSVCKTRIPTEY